MVSRSPVVRAVFVLSFVLFSALRAAPQAAGVRARVTQLADETNFVTLRGNTHPLARPENDRGAAPDNLPMERILLVLRRGPEQEAALRKLLDNQQVKSSPSYHQWLTPEQFGQQFGPADADIQAVTSWLATEGFQVKRVAAGRTVIEFSGTAGQVRQAFRTEIHKFVVNGKEHWANASDPQIPAALAPVVAGIDSLHNFLKQPMYRRLGNFSRSKATGEVKPLFTFTEMGTTSYALGPTDFATIYNVLPLWQAGIDGAGQSIAVVGRSNLNIQDVENFRSLFGLPPNDPQIVLDGPDPGVVDLNEEGEADVDLQWSGAIAKNATILFVVSETTESSDGSDLSALYIIDNNLAPVMTESFGSCEAALGTGGNAFENALWEQAAAQGITVMVAAGDTGSAGCDAPSFEAAAQFGLAVSGNASTPFNVAVGGTDFNDLSSLSQYWSSTNSSPSESSAKSYIPESTWNDSCAQSGQPSECTSVSSSGSDLTAGSGGPSNCATSTALGVCTGAYAKPPWQTGAGVPQDMVRDTPDVSLFAGNGENGSFYIFCQMDANPVNTSSCDLNAPYQDFVGAGGTSFSTPTFAAIIALVNQKTSARQGLANYVLYPLAAQKGASCTSNAAAVSASSCIFYDIVTGNNSVACQGGSPNCSNTTAGGYGILEVNPPSNPSPAWTTTAGYDLATGLGSVNAADLVNNWTSVSFKPTTTTLASLSPTTLTHGQTVNVTVNVTSESGTPTGDVALLAGPTGSQVGVGFLTLSNGTVSGATDMLPGGTYGVTAHYAGDGTFGASDSTPPTQVTVNPESSQTFVGLVTFDLSGNVTSSNATTAAYGSPYVLRVDVTNSTGQKCSSSTTPIPCPSGQVTVTANGQPLPNQGANSPSAYNLNSQGYLEDQFVQFPAGSYTVVASYQGNSSYNPSQSAGDAIAITTATTSTGITAKPSSVQAGAKVTLTALVSTESSGAAPTGTVQFLNGSSPITGTVTYTGTAGSTTGPASLQASLTTTFSSTASVTAKYSGDGNYSGSTSAPTTVTVPPGFNLTANPSSITISSPGGSATSTITLTPTNGFTGAVSFTCTVPVAMTESTCSVSPTPLTTSGTTTLTVDTTAPSSVGGRFKSPRWPWAGLGGVLAAFLLLLVLAKRRRPRLAFGFLLFALLAAAFAACGGGGSSGGMTNPGTPAGTYTIVVTGTNASVTPSPAANVTVTVQ